MSEASVRGLSLSPLHGWNSARFFSSLQQRRMFLDKGASIYDVRSGRGSPKSRRKEQNQLISVCDKGGRGKKNAKSWRVSYMWKPPNV